MYGFADPAEPVVNPAPMRPRPKPQKSPAEMYSDTPALGIITGCLLLANLVIPWGIGPKGVAMSWQVLGEAPIVVTGTFYTWWACGLAAIILGSVLKGLARQTSYLGLGGVCVIMLLVSIAWFRRMPGVPVFSGGGDGSGTLTGTLTIFGLIGCAVLSHVRLGAPQRLWVSVVQSICGGLAAVLMLGALIMNIKSVSDLPRGVTGAIGFDLVFMLLLQAIFAIGSGLVIFDLFGTRREAPGLTKTSLSLIYAGLGALALYLLFRPVAATGSGILLLPTLHMLAVAGSISFLLGGGLVGVIVHLLWKRELAK
jgi:hypothetical protein